MQTAADLPSIPLTQWQREGEYFEHQQQRIFYRRSGKSGEVLLLIHGFPTASWDWSKLWTPLAQHFQLIAPDMIGFGFSAKPTNFPYSVTAQADLLDALLQRLGVDSCHVLAHDYGDTIAQELLARQQHGALKMRLKSVCFLNGGLFPETHRALLIQKLVLSPLGPLISRLHTKPRFTATMKGLFAPSKQPTQEEIDGFWELVTRDGGNRVMPKHIRYILERRINRQRFVAAIAKATIPIRVIDGEIDPVSGAHMVARYREIIPSPDAVLLSDTGHYPQVENPAAVLEAFLEFHRGMKKT